MKGRLHYDVIVIKGLSHVIIIERTNSINSISKTLKIMI